jgi:hypothetical protein
VLALWEIAPLSHFIHPFYPHFHQNTETRNEDSGEDAAVKITLGSPVRKCLLQTLRGPNISGRSSFNTDGKPEVLSTQENGWEMFFFSLGEAVQDLQIPKTPFKPSLCHIWCGTSGKLFHFCGFQGPYLCYGTGCVHGSRRGDGNTTSLAKLWGRFGD